MIPNIGYIALITALLVSIAQFPLVLHIKNQRFAAYRKFAGILPTVSAALTMISFLCLVYSYAVSDFSVLNVYNNSHTIKPFVYKISASWGNHEGSMLLLALILSIYNFVFSKIHPDEDLFKSRVSSIQSFIISGFYSFIIFTSNPFERIFPTPENGLGLNPLLQDIGLAIHPPVLYIGYVGLSIGLSFSIAALMQANADKKWAAQLKGWVLFSWSFLTFGIGMGSWWAYRELGWGGFWFWDPVENSSLMPWLAATALLHSLIVMEKRDSLKAWTLLLGIFTFSLSLIGIFLVRSGILTSVHSFATDPTRGTFILIFLGIVINLSLGLFAAYAHKIKSKNNFSPLSKEGGILINNLLLTIACAVILLGTLYPILLEIFSKYRVAVGAPYFNSTFNYIVLPLLALASIFPALKWQESKPREAILKSALPFAIGAVAGITIYIIKGQSAIAAIAIALSIWLIASMLKILLNKIKSSGVITYPFYGMVMSHIGVAVLTIGITSVSIWGLEDEKIIKIGESMQMGEYEVTLEAMHIAAKDNYLTRLGSFNIAHNGETVAKLTPEVRYYPVEKNNTTESAIYYNLLSNIYLAMGDSDGKGGFVIRSYYKPLVNLIWFGCMLMSLGGLLALLRKKI